MRRVSICCLGCLLLWGCSEGPKALSSRPAKKDVAGVYKIDSWNKGAGEAIPTTSTLKLCEDGSFVMEKLPGWVPFDRALCIGKMWSGAGSWDIRSDAWDRHVYLFLDFSELGSIPAGKGGPYTSYLGRGTSRTSWQLKFVSDQVIEIVQAGGDCGLKVTLGDPDGPYYTLVKQKLQSTRAGS